MVPVERNPAHRGLSAPSSALSLSRPPLFIRLATEVGLVTLAALTAVAPATLRLSPVAPRVLVALWAALACVALGPMMVVVVALRLSEPGVRELLGGRAALRLFITGLCFLALLVGLTVLGAVLRATTHNHALAGVTFACLAVPVALFLTLSGMRLVRLLEAAKTWAMALVLVLLSILILGAVAALVSRILGATATNSANASAIAALIDVPVFALCALVVSRRAVAELPGLSLLALVGVPLAVALISIGSPMLHEKWVRSMLGELAPALGSAVSLAANLQPTPCARANCQ